MIKTTFLLRQFQFLHSAHKTTPRQLVSLPFAKFQLLTCFSNFLLLYENFMFSFSATEKRSEVEFCTRVGLGRGYNHPNFY